MNELSSPSHPPLSTQQNHLEMDFFWEKNRRYFLTGGIVLGIIAIGAVLFFVRDYRIRQVSEALLSRASTMEQLQAVISKYPSSKAAASALLLLAAEQRRLGKLKESDTTYQKFLTKFPKHPLVSGAALGIAENILVAGRLEEGIAALETLAAQYPISYVAPVALYTKANLLATQPGKESEAKQQLRNLNKQFPDSVSARYADNLLAVLGTQQNSNPENISTPEPEKK